MKKVIALCIIFLMAFTSCISNEDAVEITASSQITKSTSITIAKTNGTATTFEDSSSVTIADAITNIGDASSITVDALSYKVKNFIGNTDGIASITLKINDVVYTSEVDINVSNAATAGTVFEITDASLISQLQNILLNDAEVTIQFSGSALSDAGDMSFDIEFSINLTATLS